MSNNMKVIGVNLENNVVVENDKGQRFIIVDGDYYNAREYEDYLRLQDKERNLPIEKKIQIRFEEVM